MSTNYSGSAFRRSIVHYTVGRILNAIANFFIFVWVASQLPEQQYANYVAAFALLEIGLVLSGVGMDWVSAVYIPQVKLKAAGNMLEKFVWWCATVQAGALLVGSGALFALAPELAAWLGLDGASKVLQIYAVVMLVEGISRAFRDQLLSCLLLQGAAQISQLVRNAAMLVLAFWLFQYDGWRTAEGLALAELCASAGSLLVAGIFLYRHLVASRNDSASDPDWILPRRGLMLRTGWNAWLSNLANLTWGGQLVILLATRLIGADATAPLGFARNLSEQVRKYMPMEFLFAVMRTLLISRFALEGDCKKLGVRAGLMYKVNLLFLLPILVLAVVRGDELCGLLSGGRYESAHWLLVGWLSLLVAWAHHRLTDLLAHTLGRSALTRQASIQLMITPLVLLAIVQFSQWELLFLVLLLAELSYSVMVLLRLRTTQWGYRPHWAGLVKCFVATGLAGIALRVVHPGTGAIPLLLDTAMAFAVMWAAVILLQAWSGEEAVLLPARLPGSRRARSGT